MQTRIHELTEFIEKYGIDFLNDGTKKRILRALNEGNDKLASEILNSIDKEWIDRTKEIQRFYILTDFVNNISEKQIVQPIYKSCYIDSPNPNMTHIPTLKRIKSKEYCFSDPEMRLEDFGIEK